MYQREESAAMSTDRAQAPGVASASRRGLAIAAGVLYLVTHVTSVAAVILYTPLLNHADNILSAGPDTPVLVGALLEVILAFAVIGTAVTLFPVVKRQNESVALGYVGLRTLEAGIIVVGVVSLVAVVTLRQHAGGDADTASLITVGKALVAVHNWTFLIGPGLTSGTNTVLMAYLMYRSRLVPRWIPWLGLVGGPLVVASNTAVMFGLYPQFSSWAGVAAVLEFAWELALALWLIIRGFNASAAILAAPRMSAE
jgi:hypothetical protein